MQINKVEICGVNTSELPVLKNNQMMELLLKIKEGDEEARQEFVRGNLRLVLSVIQKFNNRGENIDDLFQIGCIGLIKAIDNFDLSQNVRFSTYAVPMIIGEIRRYLRDNNPIRVSRSLKDIAYKALQVRERLVRNNAKEPTVSEIAKELELEVEDVVMALDAIQDPISLFDPVYQDNGDAIFVMDQVQDKKDTDENWLQEIAFQRKTGIGIVLVSHDLGVVARIADRVAVMYAGKIVEIGTAEEIFYDPRHPYTWGLLGALPSQAVENGELRGIPGMPPTLLDPPPGDAFAERNQYAMKIDYERMPPMFPVSETHSAATWLLDERAPAVTPPVTIKRRGMVH